MSDLLLRYYDTLNDRAREYSVKISTFISVIETEYFVLANSQVLGISQLSQDESTQISVLLGEHRVISADTREATESLFEIFRASQTDEAFARLKAARALNQEIAKSQEILRLILDGSLTRERFEQVQLMSCKNTERLKKNVLVGNLRV